MSLRVLEAGLQSLIVDLGRPTSRSLGVPVGGAADRWSYRIGNALVGNQSPVSALEIAFSGPTLQAESPVAGVLFGAPFDFGTDRRVLDSGKTFTLEAGEILRIRGTPRGARAYLCVPGGFESPEVMGSRSGFAAIRSGQSLVCQSARLPNRFLDPAAQINSAIAPWPHEDKWLEDRAHLLQELRFLPGAQADWFDLSHFTRQLFTVTGASNRMGLRLCGEPLTRPTREMISEPVCPGTVQVTNESQCIVLGVDGQTIGGYPKIAQVIRADLDYLGQLRPNDVVQFVVATLDEAEAANRDWEARCHSWLTRIAVAVD